MLNPEALVRLPESSALRSNKVLHMALKRIILILKALCLKIKFLRTVILLLHFCLRSCSKWILHVLTWQSEVERICRSSGSCYRRVSRLDNSLKLSRHKEIQRVVEALNDLCRSKRFVGKRAQWAVEDAADRITRVKRVKEHLNLTLRRCLLQIYGYTALVEEVEDLRGQTFNNNAEVYEIHLLELWKYLIPDCPPEGRVSTRWLEVGFQREDPKTDFRGMGLLGLQNLVYFAREYGKVSRKILLGSQHPQTGYPFAVVGIDLTQLAHELLVREFLKTHFSNVLTGRPELRDFHDVFCTIFERFDNLWKLERPVNVLEFGRIRMILKNEFIEELSDPDCRLRLLNNGALSND